MMNLYRLATTENGLKIGFLHSHGLPAPLCDYKAYSARFPQGAGGQSIQGYRHVSLQWLGPTPVQAGRIFRFYEAAMAGTRVLYATIYRKEDIAPGWTDIVGTPHYPEVVHRQDRLNGLVLVSLVLMLNDVSIVNEISTAVEVA